MNAHTCTKHLAWMVLTAGANSSPNVGKLRTDGPRVFLARRSRSGYQPGRLFAWRCPDCKLDQVTDLSGVVWDLDDDDYTDEGSYSR